MSSSQSYQPRHWIHHYSNESVATRNSAADPDDVNIIAFLATVQALQIQLLPSAWHAARGAVGAGATSDIHQSVVNIKNSFAFKIFTSVSQTDEAIFRTLTNEIMVLCQPFIRDHPSIAQLQGVCWDTSAASGKPWPVLVFEKSEFGDLGQFAHRGGSHLTMKEKLSLCLDVGRGILDMHQNGIIHGDIKPQNILIVKNESGQYQAKVIDFGYSARYDDEGEQLILYGTECWNAPEHGTPSKHWALPEARRAELFTFGMLCAWFLFEAFLMDVAAMREGLRDVEAILRREKGNLRQHTRDILANTGVLGDIKGILREFFESSLSPEPQEREGSLRVLLTRMRPDSVEHHELTPLKLDYTTKSGDFKVQESLRALYQSDYRVRTYVSESLTNLAPRSKPLAIQAAFCHYTAVGVVRDEAKATSLLALHNESIETIKDMIRSHDIEGWIVETPMVRNLHMLGYMTTWDLHQIYSLQNRLAEAESRLHDERESLTRVYGPDHTFTVEVMSQLVSIYYGQERWQDAESLQVQLLERMQRVHGEDHPEILDCMAELASIYLEQGLWAKAETLQQKVIAAVQLGLGEKHPTTLNCIGNLALSFKGQGRYEDAESLQEYALKMREEVLGKDHPDTLIALGNLAATYSDQGRWDEAEKLEVQVMETRQQVLGEDHPATLTSMVNLAATYSSKKLWGKAEALLVEALDKRKQVLGEDHPATLVAMDNLAVLYCSQGRWNEAEKLATQAMERREKALGEEHHATLTSMDRMAVTFYAQGKYEEASRLTLEVLGRRQELLGEEHPDTLLSMKNLALTWKKMQDRATEGIGLLEHCYSLQIKVLGLSHDKTTNSASILRAWKAEQKRNQAV